MPLRADRTHAALWSAAREAAELTASSLPHLDAWSAAGNFCVPENAFFHWTEASKAAQHDRLLLSLARPKVAVPAPCCHRFSRTFLPVSLTRWAPSAGPPQPAPLALLVARAVSLGRLKPVGASSKRDRSQPWWRQLSPFRPRGWAPAPPSPSGPEDPCCAGAPLSPHFRPCEFPHFLLSGPACVSESDAKSSTTKRPASRHLGAGSASASPAAA